MLDEFVLVMETSGKEKYGGHKRREKFVMAWNKLGNKTNLLYGGLQGIANGLPIVVMTRHAAPQERYGRMSRGRGTSNSSQRTRDGCMF